MGRKPDYVHNKFAPLLEKNLKNALAHRIGQDFPRLGGTRIRPLCAEMILEVVNDHVRPLDRIQHGQVMWMGIHVDDPPRRYRRLADTRLVPLVLDLNTPEDIQARLDRIAPGERLKQKLVRLCKQAYEQKALLSNCDLAALMNLDDSRVASVLTAYERETGKLVPRRATLHDVGTGLTPKRIICYKRYAEGKTSDVIAQETYHGMEAVDRYLGQFDRVRHCRQQGMTPERTAFILRCGVALVKEYLAIDQELEVSR